MTGSTYGCIVDTRQLERTLRKLQRNIGKNTYQATKMALEHIHYKAMDNLYSEDLQWGSSVGPAQKDSIRNSVEYKIIPEGKGFRGTLIYTSLHAKLIEEGGMYVYERSPSLGPMPIGKEEGHIEGFGYNIVGVFPGKWYLTRAMFSEGPAVRAIFNSFVDEAIQSSK